MVTNEEFYTVIRGLLSLVLTHQVRILALQQAMETRGDIPSGYIDVAMAKIRADPEVLRAQQAIANFPGASEVSLESIFQTIQ